MPDREGARSQLRLAGVRPAVALLPGSRLSELQLHTDLFIETAQVLSAALNLTAQVPLNFVRNLNLYGVGGGGIYHFRSFGNQSALGGFLGNDVLANNESNMKSTRNKFGAQVGAGLDWTVGTSSIFLESRLVNVFADRDDDVQFRDFFGDNRSDRLQWVPIVLGVKIR